MFVCRPQPITYSNGFVQGFTLISDLHVGARNVDYELIKSELEEAKKNRDRILINGDIFDMILVGDRKRFRADVLHPKLAGKADIVDRAVDWAVDLLSPYIDQIDMVGIGNHEEAVAKYHSVDVTKMLISLLRRKRRSKAHVIHYGGYTGFVDYRFRHSGAKNYDTRNQKGRRFVVYYHHGTGGGAPITKGMIDFSRKMWVTGADLIWHGHKHTRVTSSVQTVGCPLTGDEPVIRDVRQVQTGAYFDTYCGQTQESVEEHGRIANYAADAALSPQSKGGVRVTLEFSHPDQPYRVRVIQ